MAANESTKFSHTSNLQIGTANGGGRLVVGGVEQNPGVVTELTAATTLTAADSGKTYLLNLAAGFAVTLPAPASGLKFKFILSAAITGDMTIVTNGGDNVIQGTIIVNGASVTGSDEDTITFANAAETVGDYIELESDGTNWWIVGGVAAAAGGITLTAT